MLLRTGSYYWYRNRRLASREFRARVRASLLPRLRAFGPDLVLVSAGFDGHSLDFYHFLTERDYAWLTAELARRTTKS